MPGSLCHANLSLIVPSPRLRVLAPAPRCPHISSPRLIPPSPLVWVPSHHPSAIKMLRRKVAWRSRHSSALFRRTQASKSPRTPFLRDPSQLLHSHLCGTRVLASVRPSCPHLYPGSRRRFCALRTLDAPPWILVSELLSRHPSPAFGTPMLCSVFSQRDLDPLRFRSRLKELAPLRLALTPRSSSSSRRSGSMAQPAAPAPIARHPRQRPASS